MIDDFTLPGKSARQSPRSEAGIRLVRKLLDRTAADELSRQIHDSQCYSLYLNYCRVMDWSFLNVSGIRALTIHRLHVYSSLDQFPQRIESSLVELNLHHVPGLVIEFAMCMRHHSNLQRLELSLCSISGRASLLDFFPATIQHLNLSENHIDSTLGINRLSTNLISLSLRDNSLGGHSLDNLLVEHPNLQTLDVSYNELGSQGVACLTKSLNPKHPLKHLNLEGCWLGHKGAKQVAIILKIAKQLQYLNLAANTFGDIGVSLVVKDELAQAISLEELNLGSNGMENQSAIMLAATIKKHPSLKIIHLCCNPGIKSVGWETIAGAVATNLQITDVHTFGNSFHSEPGIAKIKLHVTILRSREFGKLLGEENCNYWPYILSTALYDRSWGIGLVFELLRQNPSIIGTK